jgi:hypothetical protein
MSKCTGKTAQGKEITPRSIGKIKRGNFYIPDCSDYSPRIDLPTKVKIGEVLIGWNCRNCKNFKVTV